MSSSEILSAVADCHKGSDKLPNIVITGGEPLEQELTELIDVLFLNGYYIQIETSGTQPVPAFVRKVCWITVSPKINMANNKPIIQKTIDDADEVKHPVGKMKDVINLLEVIGARKKNVWLQPISESKKATKICIDACMDFGFNLSIQTHKLIEVR